jgi:hypothetical protein
MVTRPIRKRRQAGALQDASRIPRIAKNARNPRGAARQPFGALDAQKLRCAASFAGSTFVVAFTGEPDKDDAHPMTDSRQQRNARTRVIECLLSWLMAFLLFPLVSSLDAQTATNHVLELDGTGGYVELPPNIFNDLDEATVEAWVRWDDFSGSFKRVFDYGDALRDISISTPGDSDTLWFVAGPSGTRADLHQIYAANLLVTGEWVHVAGVSGKGGMKLYFNGVLVGSDPYTGSFSGLKSGARFYLGETVTTNDPPSKFKGAIDECRVWNRARSEAEIKADMFKRLTGTEPGLVGLWNFEKVENGVVRDATSGAHDGKLIGNARVVEAPLPSAVEGSRLEQVLDLDGTNSYVELPPNLFTNTVVTVEGWVKWRQYGIFSRFFDFADASLQINLHNRSHDDPIPSGSLQVERYRAPGFDDLTIIRQYSCHQPVGSSRGGSGHQFLQALHKRHAVFDKRGFFRLAAHLGAPAQEFPRSQRHEGCPECHQRHRTRRTDGGDPSLGG